MIHSKSERGYEAYANTLPAVYAIAMHGTILHGRGGC